ncbi:MAG: pilus assembly protein [Gammaproteobacteria bacterium]
MNIKTLIRAAALWLAPLALGLGVAASASAAALTISGTPLFITISMPSNIMLTLDNSGSMASAFVPDSLASATTLIVSDTIPVTAGTTTVNTTVIVATGTPNNGTVIVTNNSTTHSVVVATGTLNSGTVTSTSSPISGTVTVVTGTVNHGTVGSTCTASHHGVCTNYSYSCSAGFTLNPPGATGTTSTAPGTVTCTQQTYNYSCSSGFTLSGPTTGTSSTGSGTTCSKPNFIYSCATGYTLNGSSTGTTSTPPGGTTCTQQTYDYSCPTGFTLNPASPTNGTSSTASGYTCTNPAYTYSCSAGFTLNGSSTGTTSTAPTGTTCQQQTYTYSCPTGYTRTGSSSGTVNPPTSTTCGQSVPSYTCATGWTQVGSGSTSTCNNYVSKSVQGEESVMFKAGNYNPLAYNPAIAYSLPYDASGNPLSTSFTAAYLNGFYHSNGSVNISTSYQVTVSYDPSSSSQTTNSCDGTFTGTSATSSVSCANNTGGIAAYYYKYTASNSGCTATTDSAGRNIDSRCYTKVVVSTTSGPGSSDERQNFANWYSFYRTRNLTTVSAADRAFYSLSTTFRVGWQDLVSTCATLPLSTTGTCKGWPSSPSYDNRIGIFSGTHRQDFFNWVTHLPASTDTPLRGALERVGVYYQQSGVDSPYAFTPHVTDAPEYVCRPDYAVIMTDGLWNDTTVTFSPGNADNTAYTLPDGTAFTAGMHPYSDSTSNTLADIAFYYWSHSLRSDLGTSSSLQFIPYNQSVAVVDSGNHTASLLPYWNPANDPASWPHMVTFTVGLGMTTTLTNPVWSGNTYAGGYAGVVTGNTAWPVVSGASGGSANNVYDLWHAAIDSRGQFFSADNPQDVATAFNDIVTRIQGRVGSSSAIAVNSTRLDSDTFIYQAQFNSGGWTGEVLAFPISPVDGSIGAQSWAASSLIPTANSRSIFTWDETANSGAGGGISFLWSSLNTTEKTNLNTNLVGTNDSNGSLRLSYLRGDQTQEQTQGGNFRTRASILGDIVNSNPQFVGKQDFGSSALPGVEGSSYAAFVASKASRTPMLYVGANDGMMHAFNANTGVEVFDYVPRGVYPNLSALTDPDYTHQYYVDGSETSVDAYVSGAWKSLMVGATGAGAKEVFLMDVSSPGSFSASNILWDYDGTTRGDADMGYTLGQGTIVRLHDGDWYVMFGNGYNSTNQHAVLYLYNIRTKTIKKFDTLVGSIASPNGMSAPAPADYDGDRITDAVYAGDLRGNVWKIDVSNTDNTKWGFTFTSSGNPAPLFTAKDSSGNVQPITDRLQVGLSKVGDVMVFFGTGTYFLTGDNTVGSTPPVQSFYGIIDDRGTASADQVSRSNLLQQFIVGESTVLGRNFRTTTAYSMTTGQQGWYVDLNFPSALGERVVSDPALDFTRIIFTTLIPQGNACQFGGTSWLMELDSTTGAQLTASLDTNGDGTVNSNDYVTVTYTDPKTGHSVTTTSAVAGEQSNVGIIKTPGIISNGGTDYLIASGSTGGKGEFKQKGASPDSRLSWQQLQ